MIVSIASGKGGTGKTTVATNLAVSLGPGTQLLDCDVEEPNDHLFLNPQWESSQPVSTFVPRINESKCSFCGKCAEICQFKALVILKDTTLTFTELCHSCLGCVAICPEDAVEKGERELGELERGTSRGVELIHGRLRVGEAMAPPLIKKVKAQARAENVIIDAPPGASCPVVAAIKHTDYVALVTEPTPFGLHDLKIAVEAVRYIGIPHGIIINKCDIGTDDVKDFARAMDIPILMELPFQREIAEAYSRGELLVENSQEWREAFQALWKKIGHEVELASKGRAVA